jgi:dihydrofolate reductase
MGRVIVIQFVSVDGVMEDPDGSNGRPWGGWAFRHGPEAVAGDKFKLGAVLDTGVLLLGRITWQLFAGIFPARDDEFSKKMNAIPKVVASRSLEGITEWENSTLSSSDLVAQVSALARTQDVVVAGSASVVHELQTHNLVNQYRLLVFPCVLGEGRRLFDHPGYGPNLELVSAEPSGQALLLTYDRRAAAREGR